MRLTAWIKLTDAFDGYNNLCFSLNGTLTNCAVDNPNQIIYNKNGLATPDTQCTGVISPSIVRQYNFNPQSFTDMLKFSRQVYLPDDNRFARWLNTAHNVST